MTVLQPKVTANAILLAGFISAKLRLGAQPGPYQVTSVAAEDATVTIEHERTGNAYRVSVVQIGGEE